MTREDIKEALANGKKVFWHNNAYSITERAFDDKLFIRHTSGSMTYLDDASLDDCFAAPAPVTVTEKEYRKMFDWFAGNIIDDAARNWHRLYAVNGHIYYALEPDCNSMPESVWRGEAIDLLHIQGAPMRDWLGEAAVQEEDGSLSWATNGFRIVPEEYWDYMTDTSGGGGTVTHWDDQVRAKLTIVDED